MSEYRETAEAFQAMAHQIVWCTVATVEPDDRPRTRVLHPYWEWEGDRLVGWVATGPTPPKVTALEHSPNVSLTYWTAAQDTCTADCSAAWFHDDETRRRVWDTYKSLESPLGYDPAIIPPWADGPLTPAFAALRLEPYRLRVFPGTLLLEGHGDFHQWSA